MTNPDPITTAAQDRAEKDLQAILDATPDVAARRIILDRLYSAVVQDLRSNPQYNLSWVAWLGDNAADRSGDDAIFEHIHSRPIAGQFDQPRSAA